MRARDGTRTTSRHDARSAALRDAAERFFSVSLAAASRDPAEPMRIAKEFAAAAAWTPPKVASFAGALKYTQYSWLKRMLMEHISAKEGGDIDTSRVFANTRIGTRSRSLRRNS